MKAFLSKIRSLPVQTKRLLSVGIILALVVALPLFIWAIVTQRFELRKKANEEPPVNLCLGRADGETCALSISCSPPVCSTPPEGGPVMCTDQICTTTWGECQNQTCVKTPEIACDEAPCHSASKVNGQCVFTVLPDGTDCTTLSGSSGICQSGSCAAVQIACDPKPCNSVQNVDGKCVATPLADGTSCRTLSGSPGTCRSGSCIAPTPTPTPSPLSNGQNCTSPAQCQSGYCSGDVCCNTACTGPCTSCNQAGVSGTCSLLPPGSQGLCAIGQTCNASGVCTLSTPTPTLPACPDGNKGNLNCDSAGLINETDLSILLNSWCTTSNCTLNIPTNGRSPDLNGDRRVDETDLSILLSNWKPI